MGKVLKWLGIFIVGLVVIVGIAAGILLTLLDEDTLKEELSRIAHETTGGTLKIDGELGLSLFPQLGVAVERLRFTPRDESEPLAAIETLRLGVDLMPLFSGQINVGEITLNGLNLNLVMEKDGTGNWENLTVADTSTTPPTAPAQDETSPAEATSLTLAISQLGITDTEINFLDQQSGDSYRLSEFNLDSQGVNLTGGSFPANIRFKVNTSSPRMEIAVEFNTHLSGDMQAQIFELQGTAADIVLQGEPTNDIPLKVELATDARVDLQKDTATLSKLVIGLEQLKLSGVIDVSQLTNQPRVKGSLQSEPFNPRELAATLKQPLPAFTHADALTKLRFASDLAYGDNSARLDNLNIALDDTQLNGGIVVTNLEKQALSIKLKIDQLDLDKYQLVVEEAAAAKPAAGAAAPAPQTVTPLPVLPVETVKALNLDANLKVGKLTAEGVVLTDIAMKVTAKNGLVNIPNLNAKLYQGTTDFTASIDVRPKQPQWKFSGDIAKVQVAPLLKATSEDLDWIEGSFNFKGQLTARGNTETALMQSLQGPASFDLSNGVLRELSLDKMVCQAIALVNGRRLSKPFDPDTKLQAISGTLQFGDGRLDNTAFTAGLENTRVKGSGSIGLLDNQVDYRMGIQIIGELEEVDPACEVNKRYKDIYWPFRCKGSLEDEPSKLCGIDEQRMDEVIKTMAEEELKGRASDAIEDGLKRLFGR